MDYRELITSKMHNKGALTLYLNNKKHIDVLNYLNDNIIEEARSLSISEKLWYFVNGIKTLQLCKCGKKLPFNHFDVGYRKTCGDKNCYIELRKITFENNKEFHKQRTEPHHMTDEKIKSKVKNTMLERYGVEYAQQNKEIKNKSIQTFNNNIDKEKIIKKRSESLYKLSDAEKENIKLKKEQTLIENYGSLENFNNYRKQKIQEASLLKNGTNHHWENKEFIEKRIKKYIDDTTKRILEKLPDYLIYIDRKPNTNNTDNVYELKCLNCQKTFFINRGFYVHRLKNNTNICLNCNPSLRGKSKMELDLLSFIRNNYSGKIISNTKSVINNELDIYLPELNLAIEFNGLYWHSNMEKNNTYHYDKFFECVSKNIYLIHVYEDDWLYKQDKIKSIILANIKTDDEYETIIIDNYDNDLIKTFVENNYIYDYTKTDVNIVALCDNEIICVLMFNFSENEYEMLLPCFKNYNYSELTIRNMIEYFINKYNSNIRTFVDSSYIIKNIYNELKFEKIFHYLPSFQYICNDVRVNTEFDANTDYYGIYDSGCIEFIYTQK